MTLEEATDIVLACTGTGHSGLPLWQYMPGMQITSTLDRHDPEYHHPSRIYETDEWPIPGPTPHYVKFVGRRYAEPGLHLLNARADLVRPDFTDELTVQALWLLVQRAYNAAGLRVRQEQLIDEGRISSSAWHSLSLAECQRYFGTPVEVFARMLQQAPVKS